jgi:flagellar motor switch protein FliM
MTPGAFDFRKPPPGEFGRQATKWLTAACRLAAGAWSRLLPYPTELTLGGVEVVGAGAGLDALAEDATAIPLTPANPADGAALLVFRRPVLLALLGGLVGEATSSLPADREPTELERSVVGYLARELFADPLEKTWPAADPPRLTPGSPLPPRAAWGGGANDMILFAWLNVAAPFGEHPVYLLVPRGGAWGKLAASGDRARPAPAAPTEQMVALVREMPVELTVLLGSAELSMQDVADLRAGDVLVLRQKVDQPLDGLVSGARKFRVWPGVVGGRAAVVIDAPAEEE